MTGSRSTKRYLSYEEAYGRPFDDMLIRVPDLTKIKRLISYQPKYDLRQTLEQIIEYEKNRLQATGA
jgi:nucleoside-diphosphate-sugar epimerase